MILKTILFLIILCFLTASQLLHGVYAESSLADWTQAWAAIFQCILTVGGFFFLYQAFNQGNKNLQLQTIALRNEFRPIIVLEEPGSEEEKNAATKYKFVFIFKIQNQDALWTEFSTVATKYLKYYNLDGTTFSLKCPPRLKVNDKMVICCSFETVQDEKIDIIAEAKELFIQIKVQFYDENGFKYEQHISTPVIADHQPFLDKVRYL